MAGEEPVLMTFACDTGKLATQGDDGLCHSPATETPTNWCSLWGGADKLKINKERGCLQVSVAIYITKISRYLNMLF